MSVPAFGQEMRDQQFSHLRREVAFLNHGSYGVVSKQVKDAQLAMLAQYDSDPDMFRRHLRDENWETSRQEIAPFFGTTADRIALVTNTTTGINSVLKSLTFQPGDAILQNNWTYGAVKNTIAVVAQRTPDLEVIELEHAYPIQSTQHVVQEYETILDANPNIKLAVIDHISSQPAILFPISELITVCKSRGVMVMIDGAHCAGHVPLNLNALGADFYATSLHKWLYCARGCGILYVDPQYHNIIRPAITSFRYDETFPANFIVQGLRDDVPLFESKAGVNFYGFVGGMSAITAYISDLISRMAAMLIAAWGSGQFNVPPEMVPPFMRVVRLPNMPFYELTEDGADQIFSHLREIYSIWCPVRYINGTFFTRISCNIYCIEGDFNRLRDAILTLSAAPFGDRRGKKLYDCSEDRIVPAPFLGRYKGKKSKMCVIQ